MIEKWSGKTAKRRVIIEGAAAKPGHALACDLDIPVELKDYEIRIIPKGLK